MSFIALKARDKGAELYGLTLAKAQAHLSALKAVPQTANKVPNVDYVSFEGALSHMNVHFFIDVKNPFFWILMCLIVLLEIVVGLAGSS